MTAGKPILLIDNEEGICRMVEAILGDSGFQVEAFTRSFDAVEQFEGGRYAAVITDIKMPGMDGLEVLERIKEKEPDLPVLMITAFATVEMSIQALRKGAYDMLTKPFEPEELLYRVRNALRQAELREENRGLREELAGKAEFDAIVGDSPELAAVLEQARRVAPRDIPLLITGESGTGKELVAQAVHGFSPRREKRFVAINCGALPETLLEGELFGHKRGAFTGADRDRRGLLMEADGGTLFLDEVGNLPMNVQKTLLRFLQEREFYRVGDPRPTRVDVRVLSATNADLAAAVHVGSFREDLYYRLNVMNLHVPALRERASDIPLLVARFVAEQNRRFRTHIKGLSPEAMVEARRYPWPGNVRQLKNAIAASVAVAQEEWIGPDLFAQFLGPREAPGRESNGGGGQEEYAPAFAAFEEAYLRRLLSRTGGNVEEVARLSGLNIATVYRKLNRHRLRRTDPA